MALNRYPNRVDYYITNTFSVRHTRTLRTTIPRIYQLVFKRHHWNAFMAFVFAFAALIVPPGFLIENPFFQFPTAASAFLFCVCLISLFGMFLYWTGGWGATAIIVFLVVANQLTKYDLFGLQPLYGINYKTEKATYNLESFRAISTDSIIEKDKKYVTGDI